MKSTLTACVILALSSGFAGCDDPPAEEESAPEATATEPATAATPEAPQAAADDEAPIPELSVDEVARLIETDAAVVYDANGEETRNREGCVPSARLLSSSGRFDPATELPADHATKLVFYCGNEDCHASDGAAERARTAGYSDVNVMRAGIAGWKAAGRDTVPPA